MGLKVFKIIFDILFRTLVVCIGIPVYAISITVETMFRLVSLNLCDSDDYVSHKFINNMVNKLLDLDIWQR